MLGLFVPTSGLGAAAADEWIVRSDLSGPGSDGFEVFSYDVVETTEGAGGHGIILKPGQTYPIHFNVNGPCAVYVSLITPSPALHATWCGRTTDIPPNIRFYHGLRQKSPDLATISPSGELYGNSPAKKGESVSQELFVGVGEFTEGSINLTAEGDGARLTRIAVRKLTPEEYKLANYVNNPTGNRRIIYNNDGFSNGFGDAGWDYRSLLEQINPYANSDVRQVDWQPLVSGVVSYPSKYADYFGDGISEWAREADRTAASNYRKLEDSGLPLFPTLVRRGKEIGLPVWGSLRMSAYYTNEYATIFNGKLWRDHPEYRIRNRAGEVASAMKMSYAFEAVRNQRLGVLVEMAEMGCQGVNLDFCRYPEILGYDEPLISGFLARYGEDPRHLPEGDPRWVAYRCETMSQFMRDLKARLAPIGEKRGEPVKVSVRIPASGYNEFGFDPVTWIKEGLIDQLIVGWPSLDRPYDLTAWKNMVRNTKVELFGNIERMIHVGKYFEATDKQVRDGHQAGPSTSYRREDYLRRAADLYNQGADGIYLFNNFFAGGISQSLGILGDKEWVKRWSELEDPAKLHSDIIVISKTPPSE